MMTREEMISPAQMMRKRDVFGTAAPEESEAAGGNLVAAICLRAKEEKAFRPAAVMIEYIPIDLATDPAQKPRLASDMPADVARAYNAFYSDPETAESPYISPLFASNEQLKDFPDTLLITAQNDSLTFEDEEFLLKLARTGVTVTYRRFPDSLHGFTLNRNGAWKESVALIHSFFRRHLADSISTDHRAE